MGYLLVVAAIALLILVHEAGHFLAARGCGLPVARFSLGFGPRIWSYWNGGTEYRVAAIPLGGYVLLAIKDLCDRGRHSSPCRVARPPRPGKSRSDWQRNP
jgi:regulator of sigma E protease